MDSVDGVQMAVDRYMLDFFEAARGFPSKSENPTPLPDTDPAEKVLLAYRALENSILALEDAEVSREEQERTMLGLQAEYDSVKREIIVIESTLRSLDQSNDARIREILQARRGRIDGKSMG